MSGSTFGLRGRRAGSVAALALKGMSLTAGSSALGVAVLPVFPPVAFPAPLADVFDDFLVVLGVVGPFLSLFFLSQPKAKSSAALTTIACKPVRT
jgi:hypothetical protein